MKYLANMITKMMSDNEFIEHEQADDTLEQMKDSFAKYEQSENPFIQKINAFFNHPVGVMIVMFFYAIIGKKFKDLRRIEEGNDMKDAIKKSIEREIIEDLTGERLQ